MKKSIVLGLAATLLTFGPLVAGAKPQSKASKPVASQTMQKQQPAGTMSQSPTTAPSATTTKTGTKAVSSRIHKLSGTVDNVSSDQLSITTKAGAKDTFVLGSSIKNASKAKAGDRVTVWYRDSNGQKTATRIAVNHGSARNTSGSTKTSAANTKAKSQHPAMTSHH